MRSIAVPGWKCAARNAARRAGSMAPVRASSSAARRSLRPRHRDGDTRLHVAQQIRGERPAREQVGCARRDRLGEDGRVDARGAHPRREEPIEIDALTTVTGGGANPSAPAMPSTTAR